MIDWPVYMSANQCATNLGWYRAGYFRDFMVAGALYGTPIKSPWAPRTPSIYTKMGSLQRSTGFYPAKFRGRCSLCCAILGNRSWWAGTLSGVPDRRCWGPRDATCAATSYRFNLAKVLVGAVIAHSVLQSLVVLPLNKAVKTRDLEESPSGPGRIARLSRPLTAEVRKHPATCGIKDLTVRHARNTWAGSGIENHQPEWMWHEASTENLRVVMVHTLS